MQSDESLVSNEWNDILKGAKQPSMPRTSYKQKIVTNLKRIWLDRQAKRLLNFVLHDGSNSSNNDNDNSMLEQDIDNTKKIRTKEGQTDDTNTILRTMLCKRTSISRTRTYENQDALDDWHNDKT